MSAFAQIDSYRGAAGLIRVIGHRGARGVMPENTIEGFRFSCDIGVEALEFDVVLSGDGVPVITHNHALSPAAVRGADGNWLADPDIRVADVPLHQLQAYDVGGLDSRSAYGRRFPDQAFLNDVRMPRLAELLDLVSAPRYAHVSLLLELKTDPTDPDIAAARARQVRAVVEEVRARGLSRRTALHSFDWALLDACRAAAPEIPTSYLSMAPTGHEGVGEDHAQPVLPEGITSLPAAVARAGGQMWCPWFRDLTPALLQEAHALDLPVAVWTVNDPDDIAAMIDARVDGIVTDYPGRVQHMLLERGLRWSHRIAVPARAG